MSILSNWNVLISMIKKNKLIIFTLLAYLRHSFEQVSKNKANYYFQVTGWCVHDWSRFQQTHSSSRNSTSTWTWRDDSEESLKAGTILNINHKNNFQIPHLIFSAFQKGNATNGSSWHWRKYVIKYNFVENACRVVKKVNISLLHV